VIRVALAALCHFHAWRTRRRVAKHRRWLRKNSVVLSEPDPRCVVRNQPPN
jgi:hypothetical protein